MSSLINSTLKIEQILGPKFRKYAKSKVLNYKTLKIRRRKILKRKALTRQYKRQGMSFTGKRK